MCMLEDHPDPITVSKNFISFQFCLSGSQSVQKTPTFLYKGRINRLHDSLHCWHWTSEITSSTYRVSRSVRSHHNRWSPQTRHDSCISQEDYLSGVTSILP